MPLCIGLQWFYTAKFPGGEIPGALELLERIERLELALGISALSSLERFEKGQRC